MYDIALGVYAAVLTQNGVLRLELLEDTNSALDVCVFLALDITSKSEYNHEDAHLC